MSIIIIIIIIITIIIISPMGNLAFLPRGKPAATEWRYPTYGACWVF